MILILALPWGLLLTNCSDSEPDYSDDNAYPPPTVELTSPSEIDVVEYNSTVTVSARSFSAVGIHSIYATLLKMDENGEYEEINATERQHLPPFSMKKRCRHFTPAPLLSFHVYFPRHFYLIVRCNIFIKLLCKRCQRIFS